MSDGISTLAPALEALLFASSEPIPIAELARVLDISTAEINELLTVLDQEYQQPNRGFMLDNAGGGIRLVSKPAYASIISELLRPVRAAGLSQAAVETLAIVAYKQPITRAEIEAVRGVRAESALNSLLERDLVMEVGRKDAPGRPILYSTTNRFLVEFGINSLAELPPLEEVGQASLDFSNKPDKT